MAFVSPLPWEGESPAPVPEAPVRLVIRCRGSASIEVELIAGMTFGAYLAASVAGCDPSTPPPDVSPADALRELMNVAGGVLVRALGGADAGELAIGLPEAFGVVALEDWRRLCEHGLVLEADGHVLGVWARSV